MGYGAKLISTSNERTDETEVDERYEYGGLAGGLATEEGRDCPRRSKDGDDEEGSVRWID